MPMLILHSRTRLFLAFIQQRTLLGGARTLTVAGTANEFNTDFPPCISVLIILSIFITKSQSSIVNLMYLFGLTFIIKMLNY